MLGKVDYQGGHSSLFSGSQMMHVVTEKQNGGPPMSWRKLQSQQIIQFALFTMGHLHMAKVFPCLFPMGKMNNDNYTRNNDNTFHQFNSLIANKQTSKTTTRSNI